MTTSTASATPPSDRPAEPPVLLAPDGRLEWRSAKDQAHPSFELALVRGDI